MEETTIEENGNAEAESGASLLIDAAFHIWELTYLFKGVASGFKLRRQLIESSSSM